MGLHFREQLFINPIGSAPQSKLAQSRQVARREIVFQCTFGLLGDVNFAFLQPLDQIVRRQVDELYGVSAIKNGIGDGLTDADAGDLRDDAQVADGEVLARDELQRAIDKYAR